MLKECPWRIYQRTEPFATYNGSVTKTEFYTCIGDNCAAYLDGKCIRQGESVDVEIGKKERRS